ncbi:hypothetical protein DFH29DRAFT_1004346 [Suillus ampliporus]|nr:hypothetical protein DFH29DRAFT_1004346 [Suillus ampliporus]
MVTSPLKNNTSSLVVSLAFNEQLHSLTQTPMKMPSNFSPSEILRAQPMSKINDIPDLDDNGLASVMADVLIVSELGAMVGEMPDLDDIPDMEEEGLEDGEDEATAAPVVPNVGGIIDAFLNPSNFASAIHNFNGRPYASTKTTSFSCACEALAVTTLDISAVAASTLATTFLA